MTKECIYFNSKSKKYSWLSNFYPSPFYLDGELWPTVEHYFQAHKFIDKAYMEAIRITPSPQGAKKMGRSRKIQIKKNWDEERIIIMKKALLGKFTTHSSLKENLKNTYPFELIEDSVNDYFWGCGRNKSGQNNLGRLLMDLRDEFLQIL